MILSMTTASMGWGQGSHNLNRHFPYSEFTFSRVNIDIATTEQYIMNCNICNALIYLSIAIFR